MTEQLLLHERARTISPMRTVPDESLAELLDTWAHEFATLVPPGTAFAADIAAIDRRISIDKAMLKEALRNLVTNSVIHGGSPLTKIKFGAPERDDHLVLWVVDNGKGIPMDRLDDAATRFMQVGENEGSGLGLSIAEAVARAHQGTLVLRNANLGLHAEIRISLLD